MKDKQKYYYMVIAKCGHVGKKQYIPIKFAVLANNGKEASRIVRTLPRVKRNHKDAILRCEKVSYEAYCSIKHNNDNDPYLKCKNKQDQKVFCDLGKRLLEEKVSDNYIDRFKRYARIRYKLNKYLIEIREEMHEYDYHY